MGRCAVVLVILGAAACGSPSPARTERVGEPRPASARPASARPIPEEPRPVRWQTTFEHPRHNHESQDIHLILGPGPRARLVIDEHSNHFFGFTDKIHSRKGRELYCHYPGSYDRCIWSFEGVATVDGDVAVIELGGEWAAWSRRFELHCSGRRSARLECELRTRFWPNVGWQPVADKREGIWLVAGFTGRFTFMRASHATLDLGERATPGCSRQIMSAGNHEHSTGDWHCVEASGRGPAEHLRAR